MRQIILNFPQQFKMGLEAARHMNIKGEFERIIVCGMGASALPGEILKTWLIHSKIDLPVIVNREYNLPPGVSKKDLIIFISYSGNTSETLSALEEALKRKMTVAAIASGGKLLEECRKNDIPVAIVPSSLPSRMAIGYQTAALFQIIIGTGLIRDCTKDIENTPKEIQNKRLEDQGKRLSKKLKNKIPIIYASGPNKSLAYAWKINFNETSKIPSFFNCFPEMNHNELSIFENAKNLYAIILRDPDDDPRVLKRMKITTDIIKREGTEAEIVSINGKNIFSKVFSSILLSIWTSYYLAKRYKRNPALVRLQEEIKKKM